jgi:hypothetical protein
MESTYLSFSLQTLVEIRLEVAELRPGVPLRSRRSSDNFRTALSAGYVRNPETFRVTGNLPRCH